MQIVVLRTVFPDWRVGLMEREEQWRKDRDMSLYIY